jgi:hypothetical protein
MGISISGDSPLLRVKFLKRRFGGLEKLRFAGYRKATISSPNVYSPSED